MITAVRAFEVAHDAIAGRQCHDAPCDVVIERTGDSYTVAFTGIEGGAPTTNVTVVLVDSAGGVLQVRNARSVDPNAQAAGLISASRALEIGVQALRESRVEHDEKWTTTIKLVGDRYYVTFPLPENARQVELRSDYALLVGVDSRTGRIVELLGAA